jgi:hypothetical protein
MKKALGLVWILANAACMALDNDDVPEDRNGVAQITQASAAVGVTPTVLARGTYGPFQVKAASDAAFEFEAEAKPAVDLVVRQHDYLVGSSTGWHMHPGPVFITVVLGQLTFYDYNDPTCTPTVVSTGQGYVDTGHGHIGRNESGAPARDITVITAPVGGGFRSELPAPGPHCDF